MPASMSFCPSASRKNVLRVPAGPQITRFSRRPSSDPTRQQDAWLAVEMLRYVSPVNSFLRTATKDTELSGVPVGQGERVAMFYPSANRDHTRFADPDRFGITRTPNPHVAFGGGGTHLPRRQPRSGGGRQRSYPKCSRG